MISKKMKRFEDNSSAVRAMFEEGVKLREKYGAENVYDFSLGNPNVPAPEEVKEAIIDLLDSEKELVLHGYMNNAGFPDVREAIAQSLNKRFGTSFAGRNIVMTVGAASGLCVVFRMILDTDDEVICFAPYFLEYDSYISNFDGKTVTVDPDTENFQLNLEDFESKITERTKAVILNNPNNPTGVVYTEETIKKLAAILEKKQAELGTVIYLVSDEPYRELAYDGVDVPYLTKYYANTIVGYSFSKVLSLPGERIGYIVIPDEADGAEELMSAAATAIRVTGAVNAPSLMQKVVAKCLDCSADLEYYDRNRRTLYEGLEKVGLTCIKPQGAFYMFVKSPVEDEKIFVAKAKEYNLLLVPGSAFACPGYVRLSYCVSYEMIKKSLPAFERLMENYK